MKWSNLLILKLQTTLGLISFVASGKRGKGAEGIVRLGAPKKNEKLEKFKNIEEIHLGQGKKIVNEIR